MPESKSSSRRIEAKLRQKRALELRLAGLTFEAIAEAAGFRSPQAAHDSVRRALRDLPKTEATDLRELDAKRLEAMYQRVWPFVIAPVVRMEKGTAILWDDAKFLAIDRCVRILAQRARLLGLEVKEPVPGSSREHPLWTQPVDAVDLSTATDAELDGIIEAARAIKEATRITADAM